MHPWPLKIYDPFHNSEIAVLGKFSSLGVVMSKRSIQQTFAFILFTLLLNGCYRSPVTPPPPTPCPWWGCGTSVPLVPTVTATSLQTPLPPTSAPIPTDLPTVAPILPTDEVKTLVCTFRVGAYENSTANQLLDSGLDLRPGETLTIEATGTACFDVGLNLCSGPNGNPDFIDTDLVGKIGDGHMFHIGSSLEMTVNEDAGRLYLGFHDNDYENNSGYFDVTITVVNTLSTTCPQQ
jgi:hypothetical protein